MLQMVSGDEGAGEARRSGNNIQRAMVRRVVSIKDLAVHLPGWEVILTSVRVGGGSTGTMEFVPFRTEPSACEILNSTLSMLEMDNDAPYFAHVHRCPSHADMAAWEESGVSMSRAHLRAAAAAYDRVMHRYLTRPRTRAAVAAPPPAPAVITAAVTAAWKALPTVEEMRKQRVAAHAERIRRRKAAAGDKWRTIDEATGGRRWGVVVGESDSERSSDGDSEYEHSSDEEDEDEGEDEDEDEDENEDEDEDEDEDME